MKNFFALILVGGMLLAGCDRNQTGSEQVSKEEAPAVTEQEVPMAADDEVSGEPAVDQEQEEMTEPAADQEQEAPAETAAVQEQEAVVEPAVDKIFFDSNSHVLTPASKKALAGNALWLQSQPEVRIVIEGHTDERGSDRYNLILGEHRAKVTRDYLVSLGVAPERIIVVSQGEKKAVKGAPSKSVWALDRRAEFIAMNY